MKFVSRSPIDNESALVQVMAWCRTGDKTNVDSVHWRIYAALGEDELIHWPIGDVEVMSEVHNLQTQSGNKP